MSQRGCLHATFRSHRKDGGFELPGSKKRRNQPVSAVRKHRPESFCAGNCCDFGLRFSVRTRAQITSSVTNRCTKTNHRCRCLFSPRMEQKQQSGIAALLGYKQPPSFRLPGPQERRSTENVTIYQHIVILHSRALHNGCMESG